MRKPKILLPVALCFNLLLSVNAFSDDLDDDIPIDEESVSSIDTLRQDPNIAFKKQKAKTSAAINQKRQETGMNDGRVSDGTTASGSGGGGANVGSVNCGPGGCKGDITILIQGDVNAVSTK